MRKLIARLRPIRKRQDEGASAVEYGLLIALIAVVIAGAVLTLGQTLVGRFNTVNNCVATQTGC